MTASGQENRERTASDYKLTGFITAEVETKLEEEIPKLAGRIVEHVMEKVRRRIAVENSREKEAVDGDESSTKKGKIYHLSNLEEEIRETLREKRCYLCRKVGHTSGECVRGKKLCFYCNQLGHRYDECVEKMVTKREVTTDPRYDPWVLERIQYK